MLHEKSKKQATNRVVGVINSGAVRVSIRVLAGVVIGYLPGMLSAQTPALGPEFQVNTYTTNSQAYPSIHGGASGCFIVTWESVGQDAPTQSGIAAQSYNQDGNTINGEFVVNSYTTGDQGLPTVAMSPDCGLVIAWQGPGAGDADGIFAQRYNNDITPTGGEFQINQYTTSTQEAPAAAMDDAGNFVVVWMSFVEDGAGFGIVGRRFLATGAPRGGDFVVNTTTANNQRYPSVASSTAGDFVVVWESLGQDGDQEGIFARRYDTSGNPVSGEIAVNSYTTGRQIRPSVAWESSGGFVVAWESVGQDGDGSGVFARRFDASGIPTTGELAVNTYTTGDQRYPRVGAIADGGFVVTWSGAGTGDPGIATFARRFAPDAIARDDAFQVNVYTASANQARPSINTDPRGGFVIAWQSLSQDGNNFGIFGRRAGYPDGRPMAVDAHPASSGTSNVNGVLEPGETVAVEPAWHNGSPLHYLTLAGTASDFSGPAGPVYTITDGAADYGILPIEVTHDCDTTGDCYEMKVTGARPPATPHWDATFVEDLPILGAVKKTWTLHVGESFADVPSSNLFYKFIETVFHNRVTAGGACGGYCPDAATLRKQMAVFVLKAKEGPFFVPPPATGIFQDVPASDPFAPWIEELFHRGIVTGCSAPGGPNYCPDYPVLRQQMAVFLLRTLEGGAYVPPSCQQMFQDVSCNTNPFADWIEELAKRGITGGCGGPNYCPTSSTTRGQMATFLTKTFGLELYGP